MTNKATTPAQDLSMTPSEWRLRLAEACRDCAQAEAGEEAEQLRYARALIAMAPEMGGGAFAALGDHLAPLSRHEALLEVGAFDSAVIALMPEEASYIFSRSPDGSCLASVVLPVQDEEMTSEGQTPALALASALLACMAEAAADLGAGMPQSASRPRDRRCGGLAMDVEEWQVPGGAVVH